MRPDLSGTGSWRGPLLVLILLTTAAATTPSDGFPIDRVILPRAKLQASDAAPGDYFGRSVALSGALAVAGAPGDDQRSGSVSVFAGLEENWTEETKLVASDGAADQLFGWSVALSGKTLLVGAPGDDNHAGSAYVFVHTGENWVQEAKLLARDSTGFAVFGWSVALSGDTALVGAPGDNEAFGSAHVFIRSGNAWKRQAKLAPAPGGTAELFGSSVAVLPEAALVGTSYNPEYATEGGTAAYIFNRSGKSWIRRTKLAPSGGGEGEVFGESVGLFDDAALVGAPANPLEASRGAAYLYSRSGGAWTQETRVNASNGTYEDGFAHSVALGDGAMVVGAPGGDEAYLFVRSGSEWAEYARLTPFDQGPEEDSYDNFGSSVALWGHFALIGAPLDDDGGSDAGSASVFDLRCREDGLDALEETPGDGLFSGFVHDSEPELERLNRGLADSAHELNCSHVEQLENVVEGAL